MANIIPMAGLGSRFAREGYLLPKALIPVSGKPMILRVVESLPKSDKWIFIVRKEHVQEYRIDRLLLEYVNGATIIPVENTEGQATSCMLGAERLKDEEPVFIASCDSSFLYDAEKYERLKENDAVVWTFTKSKLLTDSPDSWGWMKVGKNGVIEDVSVKVPVSGDPINDHAAVGSFYFRRAHDFRKAFDLMVKEDHRANNEFYVDSMPRFLKAMGKRSVVFDVDLYVGWGKPSDLHLYEKMEYLHKSGLLKDRLWKRFFRTYL